MAENKANANLCHFNSHLSKNLCTNLCYSADFSYDFDENFEGNRTKDMLDNLVGGNYGRRAASCPIGHAVPNFGHAVPKMGKIGHEAARFF